MINHQINSHWDFPRTQCLICGNKDDSFCAFSKVKGRKNEQITEFSCSTNFQYEKDGITPSLEKTRELTHYMNDVLGRVIWIRTTMFVLIFDFETDPYLQVQFADKSIKKFYIFAVNTFTISKLKNLSKLDNRVQTLINFS